MRMMLRSGGNLLRAQSVCGQNAGQFGNVVGLRAGLGAPFAIQHNIPDNADEPDAIVAHFAQGVAVAQHPQEGFLHGIFSIGGIAQDGESNAIESPRVLTDQGRKRLLFRVLAVLIGHSAFWNLHPTCE